MKRALLVLLIAICVCSAVDALAQEVSLDPYDKDYSISFRAGRTTIEDSDYTDFWDVSGDMENYEFSLERKYGKHSGAELTFGIAEFDDEKKNVFIYGDEVSVELESYYISLDAKEYLQMGNQFAFFLGGGPDYYNVKLNVDYESPLFSTDYDDRFQVWGMHVFAGLEYIFIVNPWASGAFDAPVSFYLEYRYSWAEIEEADKDLIDDINTQYATSFESHNFNAGGHTALAGLRWRF